jgi:hypothetical protein
MPRMGPVHYFALALVATISRVAFVGAVDSPPVVWTWVGGQSGTSGSVSRGTSYVYSSSNRPGKMDSAKVLKGANSSLWLVTNGVGASGVWAMESRTCRLASYWFCISCPVSAGIRGKESPSNSPGVRVFVAPVLIISWCVFRWRCIFSRPVCSPCSWCRFKVGLYLGLQHATHVAIQPVVANVGLDRRRRKF